MQKCVNCGHENRPGVMYCENCGASLASNEAPLETKSIDDSIEEENAKLGVEESVLVDVRVQGSAAFGENDFLRLDIEGSSEPIIIKPEGETIFGRRDPATGAMPDVDLTPFAGYRMGVSRRHAAIRFGEEHTLNLWDLGSSNGTYLNGERLNAHRPYRLHDGDELRLGQMMIRMHFQAPPADSPSGEKNEKDAWVEAEDDLSEGASPAKPSGGDLKGKPVDSSEKSAGSPMGRPLEGAKPIELGPPKERPAKAAASADASEGVITQQPVTAMIPDSAVKIEKPGQEPEEKPEPPTTRPIDDEDLAEPEVQASPVKTDAQKPETTDQKAETDADQKPEAAAEQKPKPAADQKPEVVTDQKPEPTADQKAEVAAEQKPKPTADEKAEVAAEQKPEVVTEQKPEPAADQKPEVVTGQKPKPAADPKAEGAADQKPDSAPSSVKPDSESQDKEKRD